MPKVKKLIIPDWRVITARLTRPSVWVVIASQPDDELRGKEIWRKGRKWISQGGIYSVATSPDHPMYWMQETTGYSRMIDPSLIEDADTGKSLWEVAGKKEEGLHKMGLKPLSVCVRAILPVQVTWLDKSFYPTLLEGYPHETAWQLLVEIQPMREAQ